MSGLTVAAIQLTSTHEVDRNLERAARWVDEAAAKGARLITLPENFGFVGGDEDKLLWAQPVEEGRFTTGLREQARAHGVWILAGSIPERGPDSRRTYNTSVLIDPQGNTAATYRKIHLFNVELPQLTLRESDSVAGGDATVVADVDGWRLGLSICYDLRFPELYRRLVEAGAEILAIPSAFTLQTGKDHWDVLLRARAIENQCFVVAPGQFGFHGGRRFSWGKSQIIDAWGTPLAVAPEREGVVLATLERDDLEGIRTRLPALCHRQL